MTRTALFDTLRGQFLEQRSPTTPGRAARTGALIGFATGLYARAWMRTITDQEPQFSIGGTVFILLVFSGMGACAGLGWHWWRNGGGPRAWVRRGVAATPVLLLGPFAVLFVPSLVAALFSGRRPRPAVRWPVAGFAALMGVFLAMVFGAQGSPANGAAAAALYLGLSYELFLAARIAFAPGGGA